MTQNQFVGAYVNDFKLGLIASLMAQVHLMAIGKPGTGKTAIQRSAATNCVGDEHVFIRVAPSTQPQRVEGMFDPASAIASPPRFVLVRDGSAYDARAKIVIIDEIARASDIVFDLLLDVLDRQDIDVNLQSVVWGTANFAPSSARSEALRDRFALWLWIRQGMSDVSAIIRAHADSMHSLLSVGDMPAWSEVEDVRRADPGKNAIKVCDEILTLLAQEAAKAGLEANNRRITQWFNLLYRTNVWKHGTADFSFSHPDASKVLSWAWANTDETKATEWQKICGCVVDIIGTAINTLKQQTLEQVKLMLARTKNEPRSTLAIALGEIVAEGKREIEALNIKDDRIPKALQELEDVFVKITQGQDPFE